MKDWFELTLDCVRFLPVLPPENDIGISWIAGRSGMIEGIRGFRDPDVFGVIFP